MRLADAFKIQCRLKDVVGVDYSATSPMVTYNFRYPLTSVALDSESWVSPEILR